MSAEFEQFCQTIARLRAPDGCPWDREQTYKSLARYLLEETYEVLEAINADDYEKLKGELGDLLLQIVLQSQLANEDKHFAIKDVVEAINNKMIVRHPHVFGDKKVNNTKEVLTQWEELKAAEKPNNSALSGVPEALPALLKALKISEKAVHQGFEWEKEEDIWKQLESELNEFHDAVKNGNKEELYLELGDTLFTMVNIARWHKIDPEEALLLTIEKFKKRFAYMEQKTDGKLKNLSLSEMDALWHQAKKELAKPE